MTNRAYLLPDIEPSIALTQAACSEVEYHRRRFVDDAGGVPREATRTGLIGAPLKRFAGLLTATLSLLTSQKAVPAQAGRPTCAR
jgi:hypothetical protein